MTTIAIIGAGLSGLSAAHLLKAHAQITLFEQTQDVGGRMATRRAKPYSFDHGAQYFTARTEPFQNFIQPLVDRTIIERWDARYVKFDSKQIVERNNWVTEEPRYVGVPGMNQVAQYLAEGLNILLNTKIISLKHKEKWQLIDEQGQNYHDFDWVICTAPAPQTVALVPASFKYHRNIKDIEMLACFSLMLGFERGFTLEFEAAHVTNADLSWIAVDSHKSRRADPFTLMVHSSAKYAKAHIDDVREKVMQHLITETSSIIGHDVSVADYKSVYRWRYANNANRDRNSTIFLDHEHQLAACGDWCLGGRVEGAFTSAYELTNKMKEHTL